MDYGLRKQDDAHFPMYRHSSSSSSSSPPSSHPMYAPPPPPSSLYPKIGQSGHNPGRPFPHHQNPPPPPPSSSSSSSGLGIRVTIKPEFRITPPPQLLPHSGAIPRSDFQFDFELERKILAEAEKENQNWTKLGLENLPSRTVPPPPTSSVSPAADPTVSKYIASGLSREAVTLAVGHFGDNPTKVRDFVNGYNLLVREMGFPSKSVAEALVMNDNDTDKALAYFLNSPS